MSWDGRESPGGADLLETARRALLDHVLPQLEGSARFNALMVANAISIAARELRSGTGGIGAALAALGDDPCALCAAIRAGAHDDDAALGAKLLRLAEERCNISSR